MTDRQFSKILIIQTAFAGDVILTTPLIRGVKKGFPKAEVHFLSIPATANILENNPYLARIWLYDKRHADNVAYEVFYVLQISCESRNLIWCLFPIARCEVLCCRLSSLRRHELASIPAPDRFYLHRK